MLRCGELVAWGGDARAWAGEDRARSGGGGRLASVFEPLRTLVGPQV